MTHEEALVLIETVLDTLANILADLAGDDQRPEAITACRQHLTAARESLGFAQTLLA